jgi:hypothetical protein
MTILLQFFQQAQPLPQSEAYGTAPVVKSKKINYNQASNLKNPVLCS